MTLLPVISKIFYRMMLERIKIGIVRKLRKEQARFRPKRCTTEQLFVLRNILEQANEWRAGLYIHLICVLRESLRFGTQRKLMEHHEKLWDTL